MEIKYFAETSYAGMYKLTPVEGTAFFVRPEYIVPLDFERLDVGAEFNEEETGILLDAGLASVVELKAVEYLARAEQSRSGLFRKLTEKGYEQKYIEMALDLLEKKNYLSDGRFARAWLNTRKINHYEGRTKLAAELASRGINRETASHALDDFFTENSEEEICKKAFEKLSRKKSGEKLISAMMNAGFSYKMIKIAAAASTGAAVDSSD